MFRVKAKVEDVWGGRQKCFQSCSIGSGVVGQAIASWNVADLDVLVIDHPQIMSFQNGAKGGRVFILEGDRNIVAEHLSLEQEVVHYHSSSSGKLIWDDNRHGVRTIFGVFGGGTH